MKYKVTEVHAYRYKGIRYLRGEVVDLHEGAFVPAFLEPVKEPEAVVEVPVQEKAPEVNLDLGVAPKAHLSASVEELETPPEVKPRVRRMRTDA